MIDLAPLLSLVISGAVLLALLYVVIRFAVRHAIEDVEKRKDRPRTW